MIELHQQSLLSAAMKANRLDVREEFTKMPGCRIVAYKRGPAAANRTPDSSGKKRERTMGEENTLSGMITRMTDVRNGPAVHMIEMRKLFKGP